MKIKCEFCGNMINDTLSQCPHCGAPNPNVRRSSPDQPTTIAELKQWYADRGLPPAEVTRFFIGINYKKPRAFGIYQDEETGNFIVYKNKDTGQRAIRYEGTDEAYAVNELLQRLKQEILQQKSSQKSKNSQKLAAAKPKNSALKLLRDILLWGSGICGIGFLAIVLIGTIAVLTSPKVGYYEYQGTNYYYSLQSIDDRSWSVCVKGEWSAPVSADQLPEVFAERGTCKPYFIQENWTDSLPCPNFSDSLAAKDLAVGNFTDKGYYRRQSTEYYHLDWRYDSGWYVYSRDWQPVAYQQLPEEMQHNSLVHNFAIGEKYDRSKISAYDFKDTIFYQDSIADSSIQKGYYQLGDITYYHLASDFSEGWYSYQDDEWSSVEYLPEEFNHPSTIEDFYFTPEWDSRTQFTDFTDTALYASDKDNWSSSSNSSYDWDSNDSWDSGGSDWGSDW